jgi:ketosteroid isomerase-like protein
MASTNINLVRRMFHDWNHSGDPPGDTLISADFELHSPMAREHGGPYLGPDGVHAWVHDLSERYPGFTFELEALEERDGRVLALGEIEVEGRGTGIGFCQPAGWVIDIRDGRFVRMELFTDPEAARTAL